MTVTADSFRTALPEFTDANRYPDSGIDFWLGIATLQLNAARWSTMLDHGTMMFVAHQLALEAKAQATAANGGIPGGDVGPVNNKSVDKVSVGYDSQAGIELEAGHWNLSVYGTRFIKLARMMGAGPLQVGVYAGELCDGGNFGGAWSGPWSSQFPNMNE